MKLSVIYLALVLSPLTAFAQPPGGGKVASAIGPRSTRPALCSYGQVWNTGTSLSWCNILGAWVELGSSGDGATAPYPLAFAAETTATATAAAHGQGTLPLDGGCYQTSDGKRVEPNTWTRTGLGDVTVTFTGAFTGVCVIVSGASGGGSSSQAAWGGILGTLEDQTDLASALSNKADSSHGHAWGTVTGTLADQTDLASALGGKAATSHNHAGGEITSGTVAAARLGSGTPSSSNFLRGDGSWAVPEGGGGGGSGTVTSVGLTMPTGFSVGSSPVTGSGTIEVTTTLAGALKGTGTGFAAVSGSASDCVKVDGSSGPCAASTATAPYALAFSAATTGTVAAATHEQGTSPMDGGCYQTSDGRRVEYNTWTRTGAGEVTVTFTSAFTGSCMIFNGSGGGGGSGGGDTTSVANSGAGTAILKTGTNVTAKTLVAGSNITITPATDTITIAASGGGGSITAGTGIVIADSVASIDTAVVARFLLATTGWDASSVASGAATSTDVTVTGAQVGMGCVASSNATVGDGYAFPGGVLLACDVVNAGTVRLKILNLSGSAFDANGLLTYSIRLLY
jgi:fibronectin-binding autotransporter adhesin